jgi:hypothetical protein
MINNIILHYIAFRCILPPGWGALPNRNYISQRSYIPVHLGKKIPIKSIYSIQSICCRLTADDCPLKTEKVTRNP